MNYNYLEDCLTLKSVNKLDTVVKEFDTRFLFPPMGKITV